MDGHDKGHALRRRSGRSMHLEVYCQLLRYIYPDKGLRRQFGFVHLFLHIMLFILLTYTASATSIWGIHHIMLFPVHGTDIFPCFRG